MAKRTIAAVVLFGLAAAAQGVNSASPRSFTIPFKQYKLKNGLRVILSEDHAAPTLAVTICYDVGSSDEQPGRTGFAHFFEHMMFQGAGHSDPPVPAPKGVFPMVNMGNTTVDRTFYWNTLPANQIDVALSFEANRMHLLLMPEDKLQIQRNVVKEERRVGVDNQPYGKSFEVVYDTAYDAFPYKHPVVGSMQDLDTATKPVFQAFYEQYYAPNNATLIIVGDFKSDEALAKAEKYFGAIPRKPAPPRPNFAEAPQTAERRTTVKSELAQTPQIDVAYKIPPGNSPDWYPIAVLCGILGDGDSSRLSLRLVQDRGLVSGVSAWAEKRRGPGLARIQFRSPHPGADLAEIERAAYDEIARLQHEPVADRELEKVSIAARRSLVSDNESFRDRAQNLAEAAVVFGDANQINTEPQKLARVTREDVMRVARKYFTQANRTVVITLPKEK